MRKTLAVLLVVATLGIAACGNKPKESPPAETAVGSTGADSSGIDSSGVTVGEGDETAGPQEGLLARRTIYFDFDSSEIRGEGTEIVAAHARNLAGGQAGRVRLEGHTDERGSREYNIGLGERRAQAVRRALLLQGASESQLSTVSYGEERPAAAGSDESAWAQNRRVEIVYLK
jgi:peptidoglycan-associated lipoprotein